MLNVVAGGFDVGEVGDEGCTRSNWHDAQLGQVVPRNGLLGHLLCRGLSYVTGAIGPERIEVIGYDGIIGSLHGPVRQRQQGGDLRTHPNQTLPPTVGSQKLRGM